ncbi:hypothetical protein SPRG_16188 [Saprolegnia parasitica CBS 223.65]|uniref:Uncharacterized protein n=1 Tax=Saprolegnia parasitica (strain CBS 223.65) TaxID=695850 RepID=A0A067BJ41_SAPPC|nr:hypothetical protein SPRG_16188 [Saprolegnia parasitica CBS 223.65]KDO18449.1 hypothetical protein SPRG_16188 [Saprolegnia parasitica CBS 223.65]|eukprot:XP_012210842.1 hypothetical protein SPRG_16188 [Saprolegnia parasitica CBS 223.65]
MSPTTAASSVTVVSHSGEESVNYYSAITANNVLSLNLNLLPAMPLTNGGNQTMNQFTLPSPTCALCQNLLAQANDVYCIQNQILTPSFLSQTVRNYLPGFTRDITQALLQCQNTTSANSWADFQIAASCFLNSGCPLAPFLPNTTNMAVLYTNDPGHTILVAASTYELQLQIEFNGMAITPLFTETSDVAAISNTLSQQFAATGVVPIVSKSWNPSQNAWTIQIAYQNLMSALPILSVYNPNAHPQPPVSISTNVAPYYAVEVLPYNTSYFSSIATGQSAECAKANAQLSALSMTHPMAYDCFNLPSLANQMAQNATLWYNNSQWDVSDVVGSCLTSLPPASATPLVDVLQSFMDSGCPVAQVRSGNITLSQPFSSRQLIRAPQGSYVSMLVYVGNQSIDLGNVVASTDPMTLSKPLTTLLSSVTDGVRVQIYSTPEFDPISQEMSVYWYILLQYKDLIGPLPHLVLYSNAPVSSTNVPAPLNLQLTFGSGAPPPGPTASGMGLIPIPACQAWAFTCMANSSAIFDNPSILLSASLGVSYVGWQQFTSALRCYMNTSCPITEDVSSTRMVSLQSNYATQMIQMQRNESVTLWFSVKGMTVGALYNVGAYGYGYTSLESQLGFLSNFTSSISAYSYTSSMSNLWTLELTSKTLWVVPYDLKFFQASAIRPPSMDIFMPNNMSTMCDQCRAFLQTYCGPDPICLQLMTNFQRNMNQTVLNLINANNGSSVDVSDIIARSVPMGTPARAVSVFGLYHSCLSLYRCPLVKMPPGASFAPVLVATEEMHMVMIYNTSANFNLTLTYPALNVTVDINSATMSFDFGFMSSFDATYALASQWNASMNPTAYLDCSNTVPCYLVMYFPNSILPLSLPNIASNGSHYYTYKQTASQVLQLIPANTTVQDSNVEIVQSQKATQRNLNGLVFTTSAGILATRSFNVSSCFTNVPLATAAPYLAASSCHVYYSCPVEATLSQILTERSLVTSVTGGFQKILVSGAPTAYVSLEFRLLGSYLGRIENISLYSSSSVLTGQLQAMLKSLSIVEVSTSQESSTMWGIQLRYYLYPGPLPTITIVTSASASASLVNTQDPSLYYEVVRLNGAHFGFPYQAYGAGPTPAPMYYMAPTPAPTTMPPTLAPTTTSPTPLPMYGSIVFPSG